MDMPKKLPKAKTASNPRKRKAPTEEEPRATRRSGRIAGVKADPVKLEEFRQEEERVREEQRVKDRRLREQVMTVGEQMEEDSAPVEQLTELLKNMPVCERPDAKSVKDAYPEKEGDKELERLKDQFKGMHLAANKKVTTERVYTMLVHPDPRKNLVLVGDKYGQLGIWDAPTGEDADVKEEKPDVKKEGGEEEEEEDGPIWRMQAHAKNSISCMKVDPANGQNVSCALVSAQLTTPARHVILRLHVTAARFQHWRLDRDLRVRRRGHAHQPLRPGPEWAGGVARG